ncbi:MAG: RodZ domain-containing protein [Syntrophobacteraceae bacterium]|jgi:cytoskeletal protein RodZ
MKELAEFLKTERLNRNLTLEEVSGLSGMSMSMLISLEACDFERFGASLLIRNTIRAYCKALQMESEPLIEKFSSEIEKYNIQDIGIKKYGRQMKILHRKRRIIGLPLFALLLSSAAVFYGGTWVSERRTKLFAPPAADRVLIQEELPAELQERLAPGPAARVDKQGADWRKADEAIRTAELHIRESEIEAEEAGETGETGETENTGKQANEASEKDLMPDNEVPARLALSNSTEAVAGDGPAQGEETQRPNKFAVEADGKVWIQVRIDDKETRSEMLHPGGRREWTARKTLQVVIGNAGGVHMKWNEQPIKAPRDPGRVLRFRLPDYAKAQ